MISSKLPLAFLCIFLRDFIQKNIKIPACFGMEKFHPTDRGQRLSGGLKGSWKSISRIQSEYGREQSQSILLPGKVMGFPFITSIMPRAAVVQQRTTA